MLSARRGSCFAGGASSVRGFSEDRVGPLDATGDPVGGGSRLLASLEMNPALDVRVDLFGRTVSWRDHLARFEIDDFARECLLGGVDSLGYLLAKSDAIGAFEARRGAA